MYGSHAMIKVKKKNVVIASKDERKYVGIASQIGRKKGMYRL